MTGETADVAGIALPPGTELMALAGPSAHPAVSARIVGRAEHWVKGGSALGARASRWLRSAEWRLRYVDRLKSLFESGKGPDSTFDQVDVSEALRELESSHVIEQIVVFDLFDLPPALAFAATRDLPVKVR